MVAAALALALAAGFEWRRISERQREKHAQLRQQRRRRGRDAVPTEAADRILGMRRDGLSLRNIGATLEAEGMPTAQGGARWYAATVRRAIDARTRELEAQAA